MVDKEKVMDLPAWVDSLLLDAAARYRRFADGIDIGKGQPFVGIRDYHLEEAQRYYRAACSGSANEKLKAYLYLLEGPPMKHGGVRMIPFEDLLNSPGNVCG